MGTFATEVRKYPWMQKQSWGKYTAKIRDPNKAAWFWLDTLDITEEATKVYGSATL
jgi:hypothetical protein